MSASRSGSRSNQRSARLRMLRVATCSRSIGLLRGAVRRDGATVEASTGSENENVLPDPSTDSTQIRPPCCSMMWRAIARPRPVPPAAPRKPRPVDLVEALEDPRLGRARDADAVVLDGDDDLRPVARTATSDLAAVGAELHRVVEEVDEDLPDPLLVAVDARGRCSARRPAASTPWRSANSRSRSIEFGRDPAEVEQVEDAERAAALDPRQVEQLVDHLDEVAGLDLDLADPVAHPRRDRVAGRVGLAGQRLGQQADGRQRRPQLVRQVVDELGADLLEPAQLRDVLDDEPQAAGRGAPRAEDEPRPVDARRPATSSVAEPTASAVRASDSAWTVMNARSGFARAGSRA